MVKGGDRALTRTAPAFPAASGSRTPTSTANPNTNAPVINMSNHSADGGDVARAHPDDCFHSHRSRLPSERS